MSKKSAIIAMILLICMSLILCACDDNAESNPNTCNCEFCQDGVCNCGHSGGNNDWPIGPKPTPAIIRADVNIGKNATYFSGSDDEEFSATAYFVFEPKYTSDYEISWDKNLQKVKINDEEVVLTKGQNSVKRRLVGGQKYNIDASMGEFSLKEYPITLSVTPEDYKNEVSLKKDEEYVVRLPKNKDGMQMTTMSFGDNVLIEKVFECVDGRFESPKPSGVYYFMAAGNELSIGVGKNEYYLVIKSNEDTKANYVEKDVDIQKVYLNKPVEITVKANTIYYVAFVIDYAGQTSTTLRYIMNVYDAATASGRAEYTSVFVYDENGEDVQVSRFVLNSYYEFTAVKGTYYIMLCASDNDKTITIDISERTTFGE